MRRWATIAGLVGAALIGIAAVLQMTGAPSRSPQAPALHAAAPAPVQAQPKTPIIPDVAPPPPEPAPPQRDLGAPALVFDRSDGQTEEQAQVTPRRGAFKGGVSGSLAPDAGPPGELPPSQQKDAQQAPPQ